MSQKDLDTLAQLHRAGMVVYTPTAGLALRAPRGFRGLLWGAAAAGYALAVGLYVFGALALVLCFWWIPIFLALWLQSATAYRVTVIDETSSGSRR